MNPQIIKIFQLCIEKGVWFAYSPHTNQISIYNLTINLDMTHYIGEDFGVPLEKMIETLESLPCQLNTL